MLVIEVYYEMKNWCFILRNGINYFTLLKKLLH